MSLVIQMLALALEGEACRLRVRGVQGMVRSGHIHNAVSDFIDCHIQAGRGDKVAILYGDEKITYQTVWENVNRAGNALRALGVEPENRVLLALLDSPEFVYSFWGAMKIGAVPVPVNTLMKPQDYTYFLNDSRAKVLIVSEALLPSVLSAHGHHPYLRHIIVAGKPQDKHQMSFASLLERGEPQLDPFPASPDDMAFWLYSSGSTGFPKGAVHLHHDLIYCADNYAVKVLGINENDITYSVAKLFFAYGLGNGLYFPFRVGATTVLNPARPEPKGIYETIHKYRPTLFFGVPTAYAGMLATAGAEKSYDLSSIRLAVSAGEALPKVIFERWTNKFGSHILDGIGSTEILHIFISNRPDDIRAGASGKPVPGYEVKIVDEDGYPVPRGEVGNLWVRGDSTCAYYWNKHEKTKQTIIGDWINTGDKYREDEDGYLWYVGRSDDMLKAGGIWVSPVEVEACLMEHPAVLECGVVGERDDHGLDKPIAYVKLREGFEPSPELAVVLRDHVKNHLAAYKYPRQINFIDELPKTATGKIQRYKLRQLSRAATHQM